MSHSVSIPNHFLLDQKTNLTRQIDSGSLTSPLTRQTTSHASHAPINHTLLIIYYCRCMFPNHAAFLYATNLRTYDHLSSSINRILLFYRSNTSHHTEHHLRRCIYHDPACHYLTIVRSICGRLSKDMFQIR